MVAAPAQLDLFDAAPAAQEPVIARPPLAMPQGQPATLPAESIETPGPREPVLAASPPGPPAGAQQALVHPRSQREVSLAGQRVAYQLRRARRRSIGFVVGPEGLSVSAPRWVGIAEIEAALLEKASWILRKLHEQRERERRLAAARVDWRDGAELPFLGRPVRIVVDPAVTGAVFEASDPQGQAMAQPRLRLGLPHHVGPDQLRDAVQSWLQRQARRLFEERASHFAALLGVRVRRLALSSAATRWGSASADGSVRLNWRLVHFGMPVIDYVVAHELAHLREMNHSEAFWQVVRSVVPDVEAARGRLRDEVLPVLE